MDAAAITARAVHGIGEIRPGDDLAAALAEAVAAGGMKIGDESIVVVSQKAVSKAEGMIRDLAQVEAGAEAIELAVTTGKDERFVQLVLDESVRVLRAAPRVLITETRHGWICANAGIDSSNVPGEGMVTLLPADSNQSARNLRASLETRGRGRPAVIVCDSFGRPWRRGSVEVAIGCAGIDPLDDWRGRTDLHGRELRATVTSIADEVAAAADLARTKDGGTPFVIVDGLGRLVRPEDGAGATPIQRDHASDLFP